MDTVQDKKRSRIITAGVYILISLGSLLLVNWICSMAYANACGELEEQHLGAQGKEVIDVIENSINFGKELGHYYGMQELLSGLNAPPYENVRAVILDTSSEVLYSSLGTENGQTELLAKLLREKDKIRSVGKAKEWKSLRFADSQVLLHPIYQKDRIFIGNFMLVYNAAELTAGDGRGYSRLLIPIWIAASVLLLLYYFFVPFMKVGKWYIRFLPVILVMLSLLAYMLVLFQAYQCKYRELVSQKAEQEAARINGSLVDLKEKGFPLERVREIEAYLNRKTSKMDAIGSVSIVLPYFRSPAGKNAGNMEELLHLPIKDSSLYLDVQPNIVYLNGKVRAMTLSFAAVFVICLMVAFEFSNISSIVAARTEQSFRSAKVGQYDSVSAQIRLIAFFSYTAIYLSMPYAAVIIKNHDAKVYGFSVEVSASLPLMVELICIMAGSMLIQRFFRKEKLGRIGVLVYVFLFMGNISCAITTSPYLLIGLRAFCGIGFAFLKYWLNGIVAAGSKNGDGAGKNYAGLNAGLLCGITVGAALGAIFAEALGYRSNYYFTAILSCVLLLLSSLLLPFRFLNTNRGVTAAGGQKGIAGILREGEVIKSLLLGCIPLNVGLMYVVAFLPVYMDHAGATALSLSYAYLINGLSGVYLGVFLVTLLHRLPAGISSGITMLLAAAGILVLVFGNGIGIIFVSSAIMGLFDGYGNPNVTRYFTGLRAVRGKDVAGTLTVFNSVGSGVQIICPMLYNVLVQPGGRVTFLAVFGLVYAGIAALLFITSIGNRRKKVNI